MKFLLSALAALLLFICIACNQHRSSDKANAEYLSKTKEYNLSPSPPVAPGEQATYMVPSVEPVQKSTTIVTEDEEVVDKDGVRHNTEEYDNIVENKFLAANNNPLSTFSIDVDEASYSNIRRYIESGSLPPAGAVRIEEMINYFDYTYARPANDEPFRVFSEISSCPWSPQHQLVHIGLQGKEIPLENLPSSNMVFLIDVSGSMSDPNKLPLVQQSLNLLTDQLREKDRVAIVVYAGNAGLVLPSTSGANKTKIKEAINNLEAGGSTAGGEGIQLAYKTAREGFIQGGNNRVILATDGDFNVGMSSDDELVRMIETERKSGIYLSVLGYGMGNYKDSKMQQ
ncbi:MAG TPA: von Willebrand factor type A domain-containing protein, partial [Chitinophagaceae bacterium]|nr:von Willebrand factor type A domain-containing protein [Chitinophagaceae bacterium]